MPALPLHWYSSRTKRYVCGTLVAEGIAADYGASRGWYTARFIEERLFDKSTLRKWISVPRTSRSSCMLLWTVAFRSMRFKRCLLKIRERTQLDVRCLKQTIGGTALKWIPTGHQSADVLTKRIGELCLALIKWMGGSFVRPRGT